MKTHRALDDTARELAIRFALGELDESEAEAHRQHLRSCGLCREEAEAVSALTRGLALATPAVIPPPGLRDRLIAQLGSKAHEVQRWKRWTPHPASDGFGFLGADQRSWENTASAGVEVSRLSVAPEGDRVTMLVRMGAGSAYPAHRHGGREECFVLEGDLRTGDRHMRPGDYLVSDEGSVHGVQASDGGCLLLIVSSVHDELITGNAG